MIDRVFNNYSEKYPELIRLSCKLIKTASDNAEYFLNKYYKEHALKIEGEFYHG